MYGSKVNHINITMCNFEQQICNHHDDPLATTRCTNKYPWCFYYFLLLLLLSLSKYCLLRLCRKQYGPMLAQRYFKGPRSSKNHKIKLFCKLVQLLKYRPMCKLCPNQISITIWKFTQYLSVHYIEHEVEVATSTRKH